jgi:rhodanese-related sulfurtransferase
MKRFSLILCLLVFFMAGCTNNNGNTTVQEAEYKKISAEQAKSLIDAGGVIILDVRTQEEFDQEHIQDAVLLPDYEIGDKAVPTLPDKDATILVYCRTGRRSALAAKELITLGYTDVLDFGGLETDWIYDIVQ